VIQLAIAAAAIAALLAGLVALDGLFKRNQRRGWERDRP